MKYFNINYVLVATVFSLFCFQSIAQPVGNGPSSLPGQQPPRSAVAPPPATPPPPAQQPANGATQANPQPPQGPHPPGNQQTTADDRRGDQNTSIRDWLNADKDTKVNGRLLSISRYVAPGGDGGAQTFSEGMLIAKTTYKYDDKGNRIEELVHNRQGGDIRTAKKYDANGRNIQDSVFTDGGNLAFISNLKYDEKGNKIGIIVNMADGRFYSKMSWTYDSYNKPVEERSYDMRDKDKVLQKATFKYNDKHNLIETTITNMEPKPTVVRSATLKYDNKDQLIEIKDYSGGRYASKSILGSDEKGNENLKIEINEESGDIRLEKATYIYDSYGNWILRTEYPTTVTFREIEAP